MALIPVAGTIRRDVITGAWYVLNDPYHTSVNIDTVGTVRDDVGIYFSYEEGDKIVTFCVTPDETCAAAGIHVGASVGLGVAFLRFGNKDGRVYPHQITNPASNFWINGLIERP